MSWAISLRSASAALAAKVIEGEALYAGRFLCCAARERAKAGKEASRQPPSIRGILRIPEPPEFPNFAGQGRRLLARVQRTSVRP